MMTIEQSYRCARSIWLHSCSYHEGLAIRSNSEDPAKLLSPIARGSPVGREAPCLKE